MKKEAYEVPEVEVIMFEAEDIITTSVDGGEGGIEGLSLSDSF